MPRINEFMKENKKALKQRGKGSVKRESKSSPKEQIQQELSVQTQQTVDAEFPLRRPGVPRDFQKKNLHPQIHTLLKWIKAYWPHEYANVMKAIDVWQSDEGSFDELQIAHPLLKSFVVDSLDKAKSTQRELKERLRNW